MKVLAHIHQLFRLCCIQVDMVAQHNCQSNFYIARVGKVEACKYPWHRVHNPVDKAHWGVKILVRVMLSRLLVVEEFGGYMTHFVEPHFVEPLNYLENLQQQEGACKFVVEGVVVKFAVAVVVVAEVKFE